MTIGLTCHGYDRMKERGNVKGKEALNKVNRAFIKGKNIEDFTKETQKYLRNALEYSGKASILKVWGNEVYLYGEGFGGQPKLITSFPIPTKVWNKEIARRNKYGR